MTLLELVSRHTQLSKIGRNEYHGRCPHPPCAGDGGGTDRFVVQAERWLCRHCSPRWRDMVGFLMQLEGKTYRKACADLSLRPGQTRVRHSNQTPAVFHLPSPEFQAAMLKAVTACQRELLSTAGAAALRWLNSRGITKSTLRSWRVGYSPGRWVAGLWIPQGILLPWFLDGSPWLLKLRCWPNPMPGRKYVYVKWADRAKDDIYPFGTPVLYGAKALELRDTALLVEGEFDTLLMWQEVGDLIGAVTLGSCSAELTPQAHARLQYLKRVLIAYDNDAGGATGVQRVTGKLPKAEPIKVPMGNDIGEFHAAGGSLRDWAQFQLGRRRLSFQAQHHSGSEGEVYAYS